MLMCQHSKEIWHSEEYRLFPIGMDKQLTNQFRTCRRPLQFTHCSSHRGITPAPSARDNRRLASAEEELSFTCFSLHLTVSWVNRYTSHSIHSIEEYGGRYG